MCDIEGGGVEVSLSDPLCCQLSCYHVEHLYSPLVGCRGRSWMSLALGSVSSSKLPFYPLWVLVQREVSLCRTDGVLHSSLHWKHHVTQLLV